MNQPRRETVSTKTLNVVELFAGIGGISLGLERAGMRSIGHVEIDPFCRSVLRARWPEVPIHDDVRTFAPWWASKPRPPIDVIAGGFPCQPFSLAGKRRGDADERWGWPWMLDAICAVRPRYVVMENVAAILRYNAFGEILCDLARIGFDAEWSVLSACAVGAPHMRKRLFLVAYPNGIMGTRRMGRGKGVPVHGSEKRENFWSDPVNGLMEAAGRSSGVAHGVSGGLELRRIRALGNAVVPEVAERVGHMIQGWEASE